MGKDKKLHILVTNDDGVYATGIRALTEVAREFGKVTVLAPAEGHSGMSHAITVKYPLRAEILEEDEDFQFIKVWGTPVDCIKLAFNRFLKEKPDLVISGINHGSNSSTSIIYSGTMAAAIEGSLYGIPSIGFSLLDFRPTADFSSAKHFVRKIIKQVTSNKQINGVCLNVNIPALKQEEIQGVKVCRQTMGHWVEEFEKRTDPHGRDYFWLTGEYINLEPDAPDTDEWALNNNYVSIVPVHVDLTCYKTKKQLESIDFSNDTN